VRLRHFAACVSMLGLLACAAPARVSVVPPPILAPAAAKDAWGFIQQENAHLQPLWREPSSSARDAQMDEWLDTFLDYDEMTRRMFGSPCPPSQSDCEDLWSRLDEANRSEARELMKQLLRKMGHKYLPVALRYNLVCRGTRPRGDDTDVITDMQDQTKPNDPPLRIDFIVHSTDRGFVVVDLSIELSSLTRNYYTQFRKRIDDPVRGYPEIVDKLRQKIAILP
jgi:hypothetical protein